MKKITAWVLSLCILLGLTACGEQTEEPAAASDTSQSGVSQPDWEESQSSAAAEENTQTAQETGQEHILIARKLLFNLRFPIMNPLATVQITAGSMRWPPSA